ncbi:MAG TPA: hypothetical protein DEP84_18580 [Chloroflexi bacterium]|nr:hypothetical protein [Chloroflexota bacterium]
MRAASRTVTSPSLSWVSRLRHWTQNGPVHPLSVLSLLLIPALWFLVTSLQLVTPLFLPPPADVIRAAQELLATGELQHDLFASLFRIAAGFTLATGLGSIMGILIGRSPLLADIFEPIFDVLRQISPVAWIPLAIIWFGFGEASKLYIIFLGAFFPTLVNAAAGIRSVEPKIVDAARSLGANQRQIFVHVSLPATLPYLFTGLTIGLGNSVRFVVAAELAGATSGLGYMMMSAREVFRTDIVLVGMVAMAAIGLLAMGIIILVQKRLLHWHYGG